MVDREEKDIIEGVREELAGIRTALEALVAIADAIKEKSKTTPQPATMAMGLNALFVSQRAMNCLRSAGCKTVADVARQTAEQLRHTPGIGYGVLAEIRRAMGRLGLKLAED